MFIISNSSGITGIQEHLRTGWFLFRVSEEVVKMWARCHPTEGLTVLEYRILSATRSHIINLKKLLVSVSAVAQRFHLQYKPNSYLQRKP